ncbi:MAG: EpsG family protein [Oscillospiraceae bacterium]|nr:EpsG family protein [Oscillospiraceae bacterium]
MSLQMPLLLVVMMITAAYSLGYKTMLSKRRCVIMVTLVMALFSGLRSWWMGDLIKYYTLFRSCTGPEWQTFLYADGENQGIRWFFHYADVLGISYDSCILIIAVFSAATLGLLVYRYSPSPYWSYMIYISMGFYLFTYSGLKQTIAMGFLSLAVMRMFEGKFWRFLLWVLVAAWFHAPALIFLAAYPFCRQRFTRWYFIVLAALFAAMFLFRNQIVRLLTEFYYEEQDTYEMVSATEVGGRFLMMLFILAVGLVMRPLNKWDEQYLQVFNLMILAAALQTMSVFDHNFTRLADYYYQFIVLYIPMMMETGSSQARKLPQYRQEIRYWAFNTYVYLGLGITLFGLWFYHNTIDSSWTILKDFVFRWQIDPYSLYGG